MIEFEDSQLRDLQEVDGVVLRNVHGESVAIGEGFDYENIFDFVIEYFETYGAEDARQEIIKQEESQNPNLAIELKKALQENAELKQKMSELEDAMKKLSELSKKTKE